jgi:hypothetical protein
VNLWYGEGDVLPSTPPLSGGANMKLKELDVVELTKELATIQKGTQGTVVLVYPGGRQVEVEFVDQEGETIGIESVPAHFLKKVPRETEKKKTSSS